MLSHSCHAPIVNLALIQFLVNWVVVMCGYAPITNGWTLDRCPVLLDSGACVPMPFLISLQALKRSCPGITIDPIDQGEEAKISAANGSSLSLVGSVDLHWKFSGRSVGCVEDGQPADSGPVMEFWYPTCAAVIDNLTTPYIMSASLLRTHSIQISYADTPGPTVTMEQGKKFPFRNHSQVRTDNGLRVYPVWQTFGDFQPPQLTNANDCPEILLQEGARVPQSSGTRADQGGPLGQGGRPKQGGPDHDPGHDQGTGVPSQFETPPQ